MKKNVYKIGFVLFIVLMLVFFITNLFFRNVHYYTTTISLSAFLVPLLFAIGAFYSVTTYSREKKVLSFGDAFGRAFLPMFIAGILFIGSVYIYINYVDRDTKDLLNYQYIESYKSSLEEEYAKAKKMLEPESPERDNLEKKYEEAKIRISNKKNKNEDMFSFRYFSYVFAGYCLFFLMLSVFFGSFFRTKSIIV